MTDDRPPEEIEALISELADDIDRMNDQVFAARIQILRIWNKYRKQKGEEDALKEV